MTRSTLVSLSVAVLLACSPRPLPGPIVPGPIVPGSLVQTEPVEKTLLELHNRYRADHCAEPLQWSPSLAASSSRWARTLAERCEMRHGDSGYGENLFEGTAGGFGPEEVVATWYAEESKYEYRSAKFTVKTGHFSQVVWKASQRIGCGRASCRDMELWVCRYDPPGNLRGDFADNVEAPNCRD